MNQKTSEKIKKRGFTGDAESIGVLSITTQTMNQTKYTVLTTCPDYGSRNVGDKLIEIRIKDLIEREIGPCEFLTIFREEPLDDSLEAINRTEAVLLPALPIRDTPMYPGTYRLVDDLSRIRPPLIPMGANWNVYPGDEVTRDALEYSRATVDFLRYLSSQHPTFSCREFNVGRVLKKHGVENGRFTGDPAMFNPRFLGQPMTLPESVDKLVFSPPLSAYYADQGVRVLETLAEMFPQAERICAFHLDDAGISPDSASENSAAMRPEVAEKNRVIRERAKDLGYAIWQLGGDIEGMRHYETCDLHVGYECHAHMYFLSARRPSVLIAEDARGYGFNQTLGVGAVTGFQRVAAARGTVRKTITSGYCTSLSELSFAPPAADAEMRVRQLLEDEIETGFQRFAGLADYLDLIYETRMQPFLRSLPGAG